jgi:rhomboid protease GluP
MFILSILLSSNRTHFSFNPFQFLSPGHQSLLLLGSTGTVPFFHMHNWWSLVSANYLHGSFLHILFNMMALRQLGPLVIQEYGMFRMFSIFTIGGVFGFLLSSFAGVNYTIGASAAICSLIGAVLYYAKSRGGDYGQNLYSQVSGWAMSIFIFGFIVPGINNWGHGGGMAAGVVLGYIFQYSEKRREHIRDKFIGAICAVTTGLILCWVIVRGVLFNLFI